MTDETRKTGGDTDTYIIREHLETSKQRAIVYREWVYFAMAVGFFLMIVWALWSWKQANDMAGAVQAKLNGVIDRLDQKLEVLDVERVNRLLDSGELAVLGLRGAEKEFTALTADTRRNADRLTDSLTEDTKALTGAITARLDRVQDNLDSLKRVTDRTGDAVTNMSAASTKLMDKYGLTAEEASKAIRDASAQTGKSLEALAVQIADPRWGRAADNLVEGTAEAAGTLKDFRGKMNESMAEMPGIAKDIHKTTTNISRYSKISIITSIISRMASAFIPGLLN